MRLHTLHMTAVGPFADRQEIDFDRLGAGGLFLFEGPTGVGKSTILDALTFALYGGLASDAGDAARLRSDFAAADTRPEVVLEFSVRGQRHRVTRSPEHRRPKRRGTGSTVEKASVHLERWEAGSWVSRSHSKEEVGTLVTDLVGLNREQFRQVVLLPQGEFATFLRADDDGRREVLGRLFGTQFYRQVAEQLQARATAARTALQGVQTELATRIAAAWEAAGRTGEDDGGTGGPACVARLAVLATELAEAAEQAQSRAAAADGVVAAERTACQAAEDLVERLGRRASVERRMAELERGRGEHERTLARLRSATCAAPVQPLLELADGAVQRVAACRAEVATLGIDDAELLSGRGHEGLREQARSARATADGLGHLVVAEAALADEQDALGTIHADLAEARAVESALTRRVLALPDALAQARAELAEASATAASVAPAELRIEALAARLAAAQRAEALVAELAALQQLRRAARRAHEEARDSVDLLVEHRIADLRGELAARLVSGDPCLVCGSVDHPAPAAAGGEHVTEEQVREAVRHRDDCAVELEQRDHAVARAEGELAAATTAAAGQPAADVAEQLAQEQAVLAEGLAARGRLGVLSQRVAELDAESAQVAGDLLSVSQRTAALAAQVEQVAAQVGRREEEVRAARAEHGTVAERVASLGRAADRCDVAARAVEEVGRALAERREADDRAAVSARSHGFESADDARAALLDPGARATLERAVADWQEGWDAARAQLASPELVEIAGLAEDEARAGLALRRESLAGAIDSAAEASGAATLAVERARRFGDRLAEVDEASRRLAALNAEAEQVIALDQYARGMAGTPRMSLVTYVLRYWFEQVVAAANVRLDAMSAGKYQLLRMDEAARRDARVGLGLAVLDRHTGRERSPGTLSGGETFYTSLALALGLADVVIAQAGGAQLDTLFIDEGFGSLDPDTLDDVMGVIDDLRGNGRVVGIVSHVPELKERIAERLAVRRVRPDGPSTVEVRA
jgi:exonuclease SbcC